MKNAKLVSALGLVCFCLFNFSVAASSPPLDARIAEFLSAVSAANLEAGLKRLQSFHTRHTLSAELQGEQGIGAARQWILEELRSYSPRLQVSFDSYRIAPQGRIPVEVELSNVMAVLPGKSPRRIYVSGHYDSLARVPGEARFDWTKFDHFAPGANDDGSGTVLTMELARLFSQSSQEFDATLVFVVFAGEEQGLVGARLHAQRAAKEGLRIEAVFNNDIVGNSRGGNGALDSRTVRVFSAGPEDSPSRQLARYVRRHSEVYLPGHVVRLIAREDRFGRGGDHTAFNQVGYAAIRVTESLENYSRQHTVEDTLEGVDFAYLAQNVKLNAAAMASLALAPAAPVIESERGFPMLDRGPTGYDARLRWNPSEGAVSYKIFWRKAWGPDWEQSLEVGDRTEFVLPGVSIDDYQFGVAAVGPGGHESLVSAYVRQPRPLQEVKRAEQN